jgi:hypothetical protein
VFDLELRKTEENLGVVVLLPPEAVGEAVYRRDSARNALDDPATPAATTMYPTIFSAMVCV